MESSINSLLLVCIREGGSNYDGLMEVVYYLTALVPEALVAAIPQREASAPGSTEKRERGSQLEGWAWQGIITCRVIKNYEYFTPFLGLFPCLFIYTRLESSYSLFKIYSF